MYTFTTSRPPLFSVDGDPLSVPEAALSEQVGQETWTDAVPAPRGNFANPFPIGVTWTYNVIRIRRWVLGEHPIHYAEDVTTKTTTTTGYKKTEKEAVERSLNIEVGGAVPFGGLKADIKAGLKISNETTQEWREETVTAVETIFKKNTTYVGWKLLDTMIAYIHTKTDTFDQGNNFLKSEESSSNNILDVVLRYYQDSEPDEGAHKLDQIASRLIANPSILDTHFKVGGV